MDKAVHISLLKLDEAEKEVEQDMLLDLDGEDEDEDDLEEVEDLTLPLVSEWIYPHDGLPIHGLEVPIIKDDVFIQFLDYRKVSPPAPAPGCSICFKPWTVLHNFCCLPCGHVFGFQCIQKWLQTNLCRTCPQCNVLCSLEDVRPLYATPLCMPAADKGVADPKISTRRFPFTKQGQLKYRKFETGRRNIALKKRSDAKKRLAGVEGRKNDLMKRRADLLDRRASVLSRAKALEQLGGSLCQSDALRLRANSLGRCADEYLRQAEACEGRAKALSKRAGAYNKRVEAYEVRLDYFSQKLRQP